MIEGGRYVGMRMMWIVRVMLDRRGQRTVERKPVGKVRAVVWERGGDDCYLLGGA